MRLHVFIVFQTVVYDSACRNAIGCVLLQRDVSDTQLTIGQGVAPGRQPKTSQA